MATIGSHFCKLTRSSASIAKPHAIEQLTADLIGTNIDVAVISESHLKEKHLDSSVLNEGFMIFRRDRRRRRGGGFAIYARHRFCPIERTYPGAKDTFEMLWVEMRNARNINFGALYHPPAPIYETAAQYEYIEARIDAITQATPSAVVVIAGDLNSLSQDELVARTGLISIVDEPTRGMSGLDRIYLSEPCYDSVRIATSTVKSNHKAIIAYANFRNPNLIKEKTRRMFRKRTPNQHASLLSRIANIDVIFDNHFDVHRNFDHLYATLIDLLNRFYPERSITVTSRDHQYVTPDLKALLKTA